MTTGEDAGAPGETGGRRRLSREESVELLARPLTGVFSTLRSASAARCRRPT
jgi:hypothetical protein